MVRGALMGSVHSAVAGMGFVACELAGALRCCWGGAREMWGVVR